MKFGIYSNRNRDIGYEVALKTARIIIDKGATPVFDELYVQPSDFNDSNLEGIEFGSFKECNLIISIGGDGTFLAVISKYRNFNKPFIGINKGSIGFLTEIEEDNIEDCIDRLVKENYRIINRVQLFAQLYNKDGRLKDEDICLNDVSVLRGATPHITKLTLSIDGEKVEKFYGDGIVVATPTGSTAYTLAAGGPLIMPDMNAMLITPICSHTLQNTSYVIGPDSYIEISVGDFESTPIICPDGREFAALEPNDKLVIRTYKDSIKTINLGITGFFQNVRRKIVARGSFYENSQE